MKWNWSKKLLEKFKDAFKDDEVIEHRFKRRIIAYPFDSSLGPQDIRNVFKLSLDDHNYLLKEFERFKTYSNPSSWRMGLVRLSRFIGQEMTYQTDLENWGKLEKWQNLAKLWKAKKDDCDGYACLAAWVAWNIMEIPRSRFMVTVGHVDGGYHAYCLFLDISGSLYTWEGSYWASEARNRLTYEIPHKMAERYGRIDWQTTDEWSYAEGNINLR